MESIRHHLLTFATESEVNCDSMDCASFSSCSFCTSVGLVRDSPLMADFVSKQCAWLSTTAACVPLLSEVDGTDKEFMTLPFDVEDISEIRKRTSDSTTRILPRECLFSDGGDGTSLPEYRCSLLTKCSSCTMITPACVWCDEGCRDIRTHVACLNRRNRDSCPPEEPVRWHRYESVSTACLSLHCRQSRV